jgi:hypothetical protein
MKTGFWEMIIRLLDQHRIMTVATNPTWSGWLRATSSSSSKAVAIIGRGTRSIEGHGQDERHGAGLVGTARLASVSSASSVCALGQ